MNLSAPTVSPWQVAGIVEALRALDVDVHRVLEVAGITPEQVAGSQRLPADTELRLWRSAVSVTGDRSLGLRVAQQLAPGAMGSLEYLLRHSDTLANAIAYAQRYGRLIDDLVELTLTCGNGVATLRVGRVSAYPVPDAGTECLFAVFVSALCQLWPAARPIFVRFSHSRLANASHYRAHFKCTVRFDAEANEVAFPEQSLHAPRTSHPDEKLVKILEDHTARQLAELPLEHTFAETTRQHLAVMLARGDPHPGALAHALGVSERTMRRKLSTEGTSFQALLDEQRRNTALAHFTGARATSEWLAERLGFEDTSSFYRAFKRWTGTTPARYRERLKGPP